MKKFIWNNLANILTLMRFPLVLAGLSIYTKGNVILGDTLMISSFLTDFFDGQIARRLKITSNFSKAADPIADLAIFLTLYVYLFSTYAGTDAFMIQLMIFFILVRYLLVSIIMLLQYRITNDIQVDVLGKASAALQMTALGSYFVLFHTSFWFTFPILFSLAFSVAMVSGSSYFITLLKIRKFYGVQPKLVEESAIEHKKREF